MSYKTILLHLDDSSGLAERIRVATVLAIRMEAHLIGVATSGVSRFLQRSVAMDADGSVLAEHLGYLRGKAGQLLERFAQAAPQEGVVSIEPRLIDDDDIGGLCLQARYSDLLVLGQPDPAAAAPGRPEDLVPSVVLNGGRPVLVVPYAGRFNTVGQRVLVAWDGRAEAARAVTAALPLLRTAGSVTVVLFNPRSGPDGHGEEPGADIALLLARHGIRVEVRCEDTSRAIGDALLAMAGDVKADLLVMGCYGRSRFVELLVGGTTRTVLADMTLPVLMAH